MSFNFSIFLRRLFKSVFSSLITLFASYLFIYLLLGIGFDVSVSSFLSFLLGGFLNYILYLRFVFESTLSSKLVFTIYWVYVPLFSFLQSFVFSRIYALISPSAYPFSTFLVTFISLAICYPISFFFMGFLARIANNRISSK